MNGVAMTFTIDSDNNITAYTEAPVTYATHDTFASAKALAKLTADWSITRLVDTWNSFAGVTPFEDLKPVKKFTDRRSAVERIWKAVQRLSPVPAPQAGTVAAEEPEAETSSARSANANARVREGSKQSKVLDMMRRPEGVTLAEIMTATGWQAHTVRGFVAGTLSKKLGLTVESFRGEDKQRTYRIPA